MLRWSLLTLTAGAAGLSVVAGTLAQAQSGEGRFGSGIRQEMNERDRAVAARQRQLDLREAATKAAERRMTGAPGAAGPVAPGTPAAAIPAAAAEPEQTEGQRLDELARIYQAMKPKAAAPIFEQLTLEVQVKVASRMRERSAAQVLAAMDPKAAAALTMAIAKRQTSYTVLSPAASAPRVSPVRR